MGFISMTSHPTLWPPHHVSPLPLVPKQRPWYRPSIIHPPINCNPWMIISRSWRRFAFYIHRYQFLRLTILPNEENLLKIHKSLIPKIRKNIIVKKFNVHVLVSFNWTQGGYIYSRLGNFTNDSVCAVINSLEGGKGSLVFSTGMAAISTALLCFLKSGDHIASIYNQSLYFIRTKTTL